MPVSPYVPAGLGLLSIGTAILDNRNKANAVNAQLDREIEANLYNQNMTIQQIEDIDEELSLFLSKNQIGQLKNEATLTVLNAESGLSGNISSDKISQASSIRRESDSDAVSQARNKQTQLLSSLVENEISFKNKLGSISSSLPTGTQAALGLASAGIQGFSSGLNFLTPTQKTNLLSS